MWRSSSSSSNPICRCAAHWRNSASPAPLFTDGTTSAKSYFVSEASVYRLLKDYDLVASPAYIVIKAADEFKDKMTADPTVNSIRLAHNREAGDGSVHGRHPQTDLVGSEAVPIKGFARGGDPDAAPSAQCAAEKITEATHIQQSRSSGFCQPLSACAARWNALVIVEPETVIRWHRAGFCSFWRWKSRSRGGRPKVPLEIRQPRHERGQPLVGLSRIEGGAILESPLEPTIVQRQYL
jgi:hypothetical protein